MLTLAMTYEIAAYEATYVALADRLSLPLVTADEGLVRRLIGAGVDARLIGDWPEAPRRA
jgi:predicted nucleic acid-binding protein